MAISAGNFQNALLNLGDTARSESEFIPYADFLSKYSGLRVQPNTSVEGQVTYGIPNSPINVVPEYDENGNIIGYRGNAGTIAGSGEGVGLQYDAQGNLINANPYEKASGSGIDPRMLAAFGALSFGIPALTQGAAGGLAEGTSLGNLANANAITQTANSMTPLTSIADIASAGATSDAGGGLFGTAMNGSSGFTAAVPESWNAFANAAPLSAASTAASSGGILGSLFGSGASSWFLPASIASNLFGSYMQSSAAQEAAAQQAAAAGQATQLQRDIFNTINQQQAPYRQAGYSALNRIGELLPSLTSVPTAADIQNMPGYQFAVDQGTRAANQATNVLSPGSTQQQAIGKFISDYTLGQALPQYLNTRTNIYNTLAGIAGIGQAGQTATNVAGTNYANTAGQLGVGAATALGTGQVGSANAYANAGQNTLNQLLLSKYLA